VGAIIPLKRKFILFYFLSRFFEKRKCSSLIAGLIYVVFNYVVLELHYVLNEN
jgi:hypothetical protein